ncbi:hypothetical protein TSUD_413050 [Trifolium subterraneum]|uniref:Legume lectin domain-containing protein n=1 Tax=Trifolium subterraneum TaxID=3900 RepID=A0A2Z6PIS3_TRISU|nr:hypothetical protein TSUD_413050 [Trifolium subterraneum]
MANFFPTNNIHKLFCVVLVILLATELVNSQKTVSFTISDFSVSKSLIIYQGSAKVSRGNLELNDPDEPDSFVGRGLYRTPVPIWNRTTGNAASFVTSFSFVIDDVGTRTPADGLIFFLAPQDTKIPNGSLGGNLGVVDGSSPVNQFVGVEFDNFANRWDPSYSHVGIDVNSLISLKTAKWNRASEVLVDVSIAYDANSKILSVSLTDSDDQFLTLSQVVDFKDVLPEIVRIGFSGATSNVGFQLNTIHSWSFTSTWNTDTSSTTLNDIASETDAS